jgi:uncharacterized membrane protein
LFIIPGIVKGYSYAMTTFIIQDELEQTGVAPTAREAITKSRQMMDGHKRALFFLDVSFVGWLLLGGILQGIPFLWVAPYWLGAKAEFYQDLKLVQPDTYPKYSF